jgi:hypothetical protein
MRNSRRNRKVGGVVIHTEKVCLAGSTPSECLRQFLKEKNLRRIAVPSDGNCFYHTLTEFLKLSRDPSLPANYHLTLRNKVVDALQENLDNVGPYFTNSNVDILEQLNDLRKDGEWDSDAGDIVTQYAAKALKLNIKIYDFKAPEKAKKVLLSKKDGKDVYNIIPAQPRKIVSYTFESGLDNDVTVNMIRVGDGHFELLYPQPKSTGRRRPAVASNATGATAATASATRKKSASPKVAERRSTRTTAKKPAVGRSPSPKPAPAPATAPPKRRTTRKVKPSANYNEESALKRAIEESLREAKNKQSLEEKMRAFELASSFFEPNKNSNNNNNAKYF